MELLLGFVVAAGVTMALIPPFIKLAPRWRFVDVPQQRKVHSAPIPRVGGIAMAVGVLLAFAVSKQSGATIPFVSGMLVLVAFGIWDDRVTLGAGVKLVGQAAAALIVMTWGDVSVGSITLTQRYAMPDWVSAPLTLLFIVGATNAINLSDGLDGLAGGTTLICLAGVALLGFTINSPEIGGVAVLLIGALLGFLRYNTYPARVFMGDTGSQLLGFTAAVLSVQLTQDVTRPLSSALPLLLFGVPIIDTVTVMAARMMHGQSPFRADRTHIHHRLLQIGFDHHEAVIAIYLMQAAFFVSAWFMRYESDIAIVAWFGALAAVTLVPLHWARVRVWRLRADAAGERSEASPLREQLRWLAHSERLPRWSAFAIAAAALSFAYLSLVVGSRPPNDVALLAGAVAILLAANVIVRWRLPQGGWIAKAGMYMSAVLLVFLNEFSAGTSHSIRTWSWLPIVVIGIAVAIRMRLSADRRFTVTPLDILVVIVAAAIPNLPDSIASPQALGAGVAKLVALFYGIETLGAGSGQQWRWFSVVTVLALVAVGVRGLY